MPILGQLSGSFYLRKPKGQAAENLAMLSHTS